MESWRTWANDCWKIGSNCIVKIKEMNIKKSDILFILNYPLSSILFFYLDKILG